MAVHNELLMSVIKIMTTLLATLIGNSVVLLLKTTMFCFRLLAKTPGLPVRIRVALKDLGTPVGPILRTEDILRDRGYGCESHIVVTPDGYCLCLHRIIPARPEYNQPQPINESAIWNNDSQGSLLRSDIRHSAISLPTMPGSVGNSTSSLLLNNSSKVILSHPHLALAESVANLQSRRGPPVLLVHGFANSSQTFVAKAEPDCLATQLVRSGYDVWLTNRRGNHYSQKHIRWESDQDDFWDFTMDDCIKYDIKANIQYVMEITGYSSVSLVGFSQGSIECMAAVATDPWVREHSNCLVALSAVSKPVMSPWLAMCSGITQKTVTSILGSYMLGPIIFKLMACMPQALVPLILGTLFQMAMGDEFRPVFEEEKAFLFPLLFSTTSTKQVLHYLQLSNSDGLAMFRDGTKDQVITEYSIKDIDVPILLFSGSKDKLVDLPHLLALLPQKQLVVHSVYGYGHFDTILAEDVSITCNTYIIEFLDSHAEWEQALSQHLL